MKTDDFIESLRAFNPLLDESRQLEIREGEFIARALQDLDSLERIEKLTEREERISEDLESVRDILEESVRVVREEDPSVGNLEKINHKLEELNRSLRESRKIFDEKTDEGHILRPLELSVDLEIAIEDLQNLREMSDHRLDKMTDFMEEQFDTASEILEQDDKRLEELQRQLEEFEDRTIDAADSTDIQRIDNQLRNTRKRLEERKKSLSGRENQKLTDFLEKLDELQELLPEFEKPGSSWKAFIGLLNDSVGDVRDGVEEIVPDSDLFGDTSVYPRILNSVKLLENESEVSISDIRLYRHFEVHEDEFFSYSRSDIELEVSIKGEPSEIIDRVVYAVLRQQSEINRISVRGDTVIHIDGETVQDIREVFRDLKTYETEMENVSKIVEEHKID